MSSDSHDDRGGVLVSSVEVIYAAGFPPPQHEAEGEMFERHCGVPGHLQEPLARARIVIVGAGGLGSWVGVALARSGATHLTIVDPDLYDRTNAPRQLVFGRDVGRGKALALGRNLSDHMIAGGSIVTAQVSFDDFIARYAVAMDVLVVLVDNNACRAAAVRLAKARRIPAVFSMLSLDGMRIHTFAQGAGAQDACLWCAAPNFDPASAAPCAASVITSCLLSAAHVTFFVHRALMGWPGYVEPFNWRSLDLLGQEPEQVAFVRRRESCRICEAMSS